MSVLKEYVKDPDAVLDYTLDWTSWLEGDTISSSTWTVPADLTQPQSAQTVGAQATIWLGGGTAGQVYTVVNRIVTDGGRTEERTLALRIANR